VVYLLAYSGSIQIAFVYENDIMTEFLNKSNWRMFITKMALLDDSAQTEKNILREKQYMEILLHRFRHENFKRAKRYYDKLFERFPTFRRECGVPDDEELRGMGLAKVKGWPSPAASPSPSPIPSPAFVSPFPAPSPSPSPSPSPLMTPLSNRSSPLMASPPPGTPGMLLDAETETETEITLQPFQENNAFSGTNTDKSTDAKEETKKPRLE